MDKTPAEIIDRFFIETGIIHQLTSAMIENHLPGRMSSTQFGLIGHLARRPAGETPLQLARAFQVPKTTMTHMIAGLEKLGFISLHANPSDARSKIVQATPHGITFLQEKTSAVMEENADLIQAIGLDAFAAAVPHLERIREALDSARDT